MMDVLRMLTTPVVVAVPILGALLMLRIIFRAIDRLAARIEDSRCQINGHIRTITAHVQLVGDELHDLREQREVDRVELDPGLVTRRRTPPPPPPPHDPRVGHAPCKACGLDLKKCGCPRRRPRSRPPTLAPYAPSRVLPRAIVVQRDRR